ncbi:hypothetical protein MTO96_050416 [Rhipicephalus appendiculatus]
MYPSDLCDYLFYTSVYAENGHIYGTDNYRTWLLFQRMAAKRGNMEFGISFSFDTFMADIVIAITSTGWLASEGHCKAAPPNSISADNLGHTVLVSQYALFAYLIMTNFRSRTGSLCHREQFSQSRRYSLACLFELSALKYVMVENPTSLNDSVFRPCLSVEKTGQEALCDNSDFTGGPENYLGDPIYAYGVFSSGSKVLTWSEYNDSLAIKGKPQLRETMLAVITCVCLVAMISVVVVLIVSSSYLGSLSTPLSYDKPSNDVYYNSVNDYDKSRGDDDNDTNHSEGDYDNNHDDDQYNKNHADDEYNNHADDEYNNNHANDDYNNHSEDGLDNNRDINHCDNGGPRPR